MLLAEGLDSGNISAGGGEGSDREVASTAAYAFGKSCEADTVGSVLKIDAGNTPELAALWLQLPTIVATGPSFSLVFSPIEYCTAAWI